MYDALAAILSKSPLSYIESLFVLLLSNIPQANLYVSQNAVSGFSQCAWFLYHIETCNGAH